MKRLLQIVGEMEEESIDRRVMAQVEEVGDFVVARGLRIKVGLDPEKVGEENERV